MFNGKKKDKKQKPLRQDWKPNFFLRILYAVWRVAFGAFKIAVGAACTVLMVVVICGFVFAGVLDD
jgi:predicted branched-subunit amino acid permease